MKQALIQAKYAFELDEVPVGAVVVHNNQIIARAHNQVEQLTDCTAHAEMLAITAACEQMQSKYLANCKLYCTLEPCSMCAGALYWSQIGEVIYAAEDPKRGFMVNGKRMLHPKTKLSYGLMAEEASELIKAFFQLKRANDN